MEDEVPSTSRMTVDLERGLADWLRITAATERVSQAAIVRAALEEARADPKALQRWISTARAVHENQ